MAARPVCRSGADDDRDHGRSYGHVRHSRRHRRGPTQLVRRPDRLLQSYDLAAGCRRHDDEARPADRHLDAGTWRLVRDEAARSLVDRGENLCRRHRARHVALGIPCRQPRFRGPVRAGASPRPARSVLGRGQTGTVDPRRTPAAIRDMHAVRHELEPRVTRRPAADRRRRHLAARSPSLREQWRPARQCAGSPDAAVAAADGARRREPDCVEAGAEDFPLPTASW
ncbi:hypothetical protein ACVWW7_004110 [Bradyrhizobium sp. LM6.9]